MCLNNGQYDRCVLFGYLSLCTPFSWIWNTIKMRWIANPNRTHSHLPHLLEFIWECFHYHSKDSCAHWSGFVDSHLTMHHSSRGVQIIVIFNSGKTREWEATIMIIKITKALIMEDTRNIQALVFDKISLSFCCVLHKYLYHFGYV